MLTEALLTARVVLNPKDSKRAHFLVTEPRKQLSRSFGWKAPLQQRLWYLPSPLSCGVFACQPGLRAKNTHCKAMSDLSKAGDPRTPTQVKSRESILSPPTSVFLPEKKGGQLSITYFVGHIFAMPIGRWKALYKLYAHTLTLINFLCANISLFLLHCPSSHYISSLIWRRTRNCWQLKYFPQLFFWDSEMQPLNTALCSADCSLIALRFHVSPHFLLHEFKAIWFSS